MLKTVTILLCLTVSVVSAGWSQTMQFNYAGVNFFCYLLSGGMYDCSHSAKTPPAPVYKPAPKPHRHEHKPKPADPKPQYTKPADPKPQYQKPADPKPQYTKPKEEPKAAAYEKPKETSDPPPTSYKKPPPASGDYNKPSSLNTDGWNDAIVGAHNKFRGDMQDTPPVSWDDGLAGGCVGYAQKLAASSCTLQHSNGDYGENLFQGWGDGCKKALDVIGYMFSECQQYQWGNPAFSEATGHFSQIVWKKTTGVAAGAATGSDGCCIVVLRYSPAGNVQGQFGGNVAGYKGGDTSACKDKKAYSRR